MIEKSFYYSIHKKNYFLLNKKMIKIFLCLILVISFSFQQSTFPNIGYLGSGYDVVFGNPHSTDSSGGIDPGFRSSVFELSNYSLGLLTPDQKYKVPNGVTAETCTMCSLSFETDYISDMKTYVSNLQTDIAIPNINFWVISFSASVDYKSMYKYIYSYSDKYTSTNASCCVYMASIQIYNSPTLSQDFINGVQQLPSNGNQNAYFDFIEEFGTHVVTEMSMGSRWGEMSRFTKTSWSQMSSTNFDIKVAASYSAMIKAGVSVLVDSQKKMAETFEHYSSEQKIFETGKIIPNNLDVKTWMQNSAENPMPLKIRLHSLDYFLQKKFFPNDANINQKKNKFNSKFSWLLSIFTL
jgi:hypothetical protein